jgi:hypothetical protein
MGRNVVFPSWPPLPGVKVERRKWGTLYITGARMPCVECGEPAAPSAVGTAVCSLDCLGRVSDRLFDGPLVRLLADRGLPGVGESPRPKPKRRPVGDGRADPAVAHANLGDCTAVLERYGIEVRRGMARCPFHPDDRPSLSVTVKDGRGLFHCFGCEEGGDTITLEAKLAGTSVADVLRRWGH